MFCSIKSCFTEDREYVDDREKDALRMLDYFGRDFIDMNLKELLLLSQLQMFSESRND